MPQMSPMNWMVIFIMMNFILYMWFSKFHFFLFKNINLVKKSINKNNNFTFTI